MSVDPANDEFGARSVTVTPEPAGAAPAHTVRLRLWGLTPRDLEAAVQDVRMHPSYHAWHVAETKQDLGLPSPIRPGDPHALSQRAWYGWAWAAYPAASGVETADAGAEPARATWL